MKKILVSVAFALVSALGFAQEGGLALRGGLNLNQVKAESASSSDNIGYHIGITYDHYLNEVFGIETGMFLDTKGAKYGNNKYSVLGLTVPVLAKTKINVEAFDIFLNVGPFVNVGLAGMQDSKNIKFGSNNGEHNRFTFGLNFGGGFEVNRFIIGIGYDLGLSEIGKDSNQKYNSLKIGLGYRF